MRALATLLIVPTLTACSMTYHPAAGPRASLAMEGGKPVIVKDGQVHELGVFGGGLADAVRSDPAALRHAEEFHDNAVAGFIESMVGSVAIATGLVMTTYSVIPCAGSQSRCEGSPLVPGLLTLGGGLVLYTVGLVTLLRAQPHLYDAINVYNDHLEGKNGQEDASVPATPLPVAHDSQRFAPLICNSMTSRCVR